MEQNRSNLNRIIEERRAAAIHNATLDITDGENATALDYGDALLKAGKVSREKYDALQAHAKDMIKEFR